MDSDSHDEAEIDTARPGVPHRAVFLDGQSLAETAVLVELTEFYLRIRDQAGATRATWDLAGLRCDAMQEGGVVHVSHVSAPHESLVVREPALAARLRTRSGKVDALPGGARKLRFAIAVMLTLLALAGLVYHFTPQLAHYAAIHVPLEQERALGAQMETVLDFAGCKDPKAEAALNEIIHALSDRGVKPYGVRIMHAGFPNAFALPGGVIVVTDDLLQTAESPDEVAGVLAHEIEHVVQRHVLAGFLRDAALSGLWSITMGDYSGLMLVDPSTAYRIANLEFTRSDEDAADRGAVMRLHRAGLSHHGMITFFERIQLKLGDDTPAWLSTHPSTAQRVAQLRKTADIQHPQPALDADHFALLQHACKHDTSDANAKPKR